MQDAVREVNARLKTAKLRCAIELRGSRLSLVATLPLRDDPTSRKQQRIALGVDATLSGLATAEKKAHDLGYQIRDKTFTWADWDAPPETAPITPADFRAAAERLHASKYRASPERGANAWTKKWAPALRKLPASGGITPAALLRVINAMPAGSAGRRDQGNLLAQVARSLGMDPDPLLAACRGYGASQLTERDIPSDSEIEAAWEKLRQPHWRWAFGVCAAFGLRPHECAGLEWLPDGWVKVADATKTGGRQVRACPSEWIERFGLQELPRPTQPASSLAKVFGDALERAGVPFRAYALRHAYALRLMDRGVPPELGARLMGHSLQVHESSYKRWLEADRIARAMDRFNL